MTIDDLRRIGRRLRDEIPPLVWKLHGSSPLGRGAGGNMTYPLDRRAEEIIFGEAERLGEPLTLVSEESGVNEVIGGGPRLLIDPIDGSRNALGGIPVYSTSIALIHGDTIGDVSAGYVLNLATCSEYWAEKGKGAFLDGRSIKTARHDAMKVIAYEAGTPSRDIPAMMPLVTHYDRTRCFGSTALDLAFLSQGALSTVIVPSPSRSFDFAAGYLLVREAGGVVTDLSGRDIDGTEADVRRSTSLLASCHEEMHRKALRMLQV